MKFTLKRIRMFVMSICLGLIFGVCANSMTDDGQTGEFRYGPGFYCNKDVACGTIQFDNGIECPNYCAGTSMSAKTDTCRMSYYSYKKCDPSDPFTYLACAGKCTEGKTDCTLKLVHCKNGVEKEEEPKE